MTLEYVLLLVMVFGVSVRLFVEAPKTAFQKSGPRLAARIERQLATGTGFQTKSKGMFQWEGEPQR